MKKPVNESPSSIEKKLPGELAEYEEELSGFTADELRVLAILNASVRGTMDPLKLTLSFEQMLIDLGYRSEIHIQPSREGESEGLPAPPENAMRFFFPPQIEIAGDDFGGWIDLVPLDPHLKLEARDVRFLEYFCRQVGAVLAHQWLYQNLSRTQENLRSALNTVQEISAFVGHEIRSPIASLCSLGFLLEDQVRGLSRLRTLSGEDWKPLLDKMAQSMALLEKITRSTYLLGTLDIDPETVRSDLEWVELGKSLLVTAATAYSFDIKRRGLRVVIRREARFARDFVQVHRAWFEALFDNLLGNAIKYSSDRGRIDFSILKEGGCYVIHVSNPVDNPPSPERLNRLFEKGYRGLETGFNIQAIGANQGLGLYFVNRIVNLGYNGEVRVWVDEERNRSAPSGSDTVEVQVFGDPDAPPVEEGVQYFHIEIRLPEESFQGLP
jgi:signal transduction histidine kinase